MREIKFRAWDAETKEMLYMVPLDDLEGSISSFVDLEDREVSDNIILMQYTGLKDKNGKGVYESDLIRIDKDKSIYRIIWEEECAGFGYQEVATMKILMGFTCVVSEMGSVIGNIYENPELLEQK